MKKILSVTFIAIIIAGCSKTPQQKAEKLIRQWTKENLVDPSSYQSLSMGNPDSMKMSLSTRKYLYGFLLPALTGNDHQMGINKIYYDFEKGKIEKSKEDNSWNKLTQKEREEKENSMNEKLRKHEEAALNVGKYVQEFDSITHNPTFSGYKVDHTYKAKNNLGDYVTEEKVFFFNQAMDSIMDVEDKNKYKDTICVYGMTFQEYKDLRKKLREQNK